MEREEWYLGIRHKHKHTLPPPPSDPSDNSGDVLLRLATLGAEVLAWSGTIHPKRTKGARPPQHFTPVYQNFQRCMTTKERNIFLGEESA